MCWTADTCVCGSAHDDGCVDDDMSAIVAY